MKIEGSFFQVFMSLTNFMTLNSSTVFRMDLLELSTTMFCVLLRAVVPLESVAQYKKENKKTVVTPPPPTHIQSLTMEEK